MKIIALKPLERGNRFLFVLANHLRFIEEGILNTPEEAEEKRRREKVFVNNTLIAADIKKRNIPEECLKYGWIPAVEMPGKSTFSLFVFADMPDYYFKWDHSNTDSGNFKGKYAYCKQMITAYYLFLNEWSTYVRRRDI